MNVDCFLGGESPQSLWLGSRRFCDATIEESGDALDIFRPGMENLFDVGQIVIDAILARGLR